MLWGHALIRACYLSYWITDPFIQNELYGTLNRMECAETLNSQSGHLGTSGGFAGFSPMSGSDVPIGRNRGSDFSTLTSNYGFEANNPNSHIPAIRNFWQRQKAQSEQSASISRLEQEVQRLKLDASVKLEKARSAPPSHMSCPLFIDEYLEGREATLLARLGIKDTGHAISLIRRDLIMLKAMRFEWFYLQNDIEFVDGAPFSDPFVSFQIDTIKQSFPVLDSSIGEFYKRIRKVEDVVPPTAACPISEIDDTCVVGDEDMDESCELCSF